jgi:hypothetical protein
MQAGRTPVHPFSVVCRSLLDETTASIDMMDHSPRARHNRGKAMHGRSFDPLKDGDGDGGCLNPRAQKSVLPRPRRPCIQGDFPKLHTSTLFYYTRSECECENAHWWEAKTA